MKETINKREQERVHAAALGQQGWEAHGSAMEHRRYSQKIPKAPGRPRRCHCGCGGVETHAGMANGLALMSGCELSVARWVRRPY